MFILKPLVVFFSATAVQAKVHIEIVSDYV
jgi:hypothetical protein